jgi:hypothetical protein
VSDPTATVKVNGRSVASGSPSQPISLSVGNNNINTVVTAQDGTTTKTYSVVVTRRPQFTAPTIQVDNGAVNTDAPDALVKEDGSVQVAVVATLTGADTAHEILTVTLTGITPSTGSFSAPVGVFDQAHGTWTVTLAPGENLNTSFTFTPATNKDADWTNMTATATAFNVNENATLYSQIHASVLTDAVADTPTISAPSVVAYEDVGEITLTPGLADNDGSEVVDHVNVTGVPANFSFNHGIKNNDGSWTFTPADLNGLTINAAPHFVGSIGLTAEVVNHEANVAGTEFDFSDNWNHVLANFSVTWTAPPLGIVAAAAPLYDGGTDQTTISLTLAGMPNVAYTLEYSADLTSWTVYPQNPLSSGPNGSFNLMVTVPGNVTSLFVRATR